MHQLTKISKMTRVALLIVFPTLWVSLSAFVVPISTPKADTSTLRLLHVVFRHGDRNPDQSSLISSSPYYNESFYPEGYGQLTNAGKLTEYRIGLLLRERYDEFFTDTWNINYLEARSTNVNRTKMSLELMLAGLYPPKGDQAWSSLPWQPIPYNYKSGSDLEILPWYACSTFYTKVYEVIDSDEIVEYGKRYEELLEVLANKTGSDSITLLSPFNYYFGFATQLEIGYSLEDWVYSIYPEPIHSAAVDYYYYITNTTALRNIAGGYLIRKILSDTAAKINGTISPSAIKAYFYSAHEMNVATTLLTLGAYHITDIPPYGAHVIFEVHEIDGVWGLKLFYQNYENPDFSPIPVKIPGCDYFCTYDDTYSLLEEIIPTSDDC